MSRRIYNKLVRDRIPQIIEAANTRYEAVVIGDHASFDRALRAKLVEEAEEIVSTEELVVELADLLEVIDTLMALHSVTEESVRRVQAERRAARGGFDQRIMLRWTE